MEPKIKKTESQINVIPLFIYAKIMTKDKLYFGHSFFYFPPVSVVGSASITVGEVSNVYFIVTIAIRPSTP